jgi:NitT/TauT family transport system permease protein
MTLAGYRVPMMASLILWAVIWEVIGRFELLMLFPPLSEVLMAMGEITTTGKFQRAAIVTLQSYGLGMALAIVCGVLLGLLMGRVEAADRLLGVWVNVFVSAPLSALVPVLMILFGLGSTTIIVTVFLFAVWIIALDTRAGVREVPRSLLEMSRSFGASRWQTLTRIVFQSALPEILAGIRVGFIRGVKGVVIGQILVAVVGFGELFELYSRNFLMEEFWALTLIVFAAALLISSGVEWLEHRIDFYAGVRG